MSLLDFHKRPDPDTSSQMFEIIHALGAALRLSLGSLDRQAQTQHVSELAAVAVSSNRIT